MYNRILVRIFIGTMINNKTVFPGKWFIRSNPDEVSYNTLLEMLTDELPQKLRDKGLSGNPVNYIGIGQNREVKALTPGESRWPPFGDMKHIGLCYPVLVTDKRWETIQVTSSSLFLGSALSNNGFKVTIKKLPLPPVTIDPALKACDLIGFTLFEDLFLQSKELLSRFRDEYSGLLAAGGPLISLTPLQAAYHLPELNLLVRGEAEFILPGLLNALAAQDLEALFSYQGFLFQVPGTVVISDFDHINRPQRFEGFSFNLDFLEKTHLAGGLEVNVSRGCRRACVFCSAVQGKKLRKMHHTQLRDLLGQFSRRLEAEDVQTPHSRTVNINDDDILQDPDYAGDVFNCIKECGFRLWGVQTSINSLFSKNGEPDLQVLDIIADRELYVADNPLVWCGTDAFVKERSKKLAKIIPDEEQLFRLLEAFESRGVRNYHYWISSDHLSHWNEFVREFMLICRIQSRFSLFGLIAHSPFLVPYSTSPLFKLLKRSGASARIKYKKILHSGETEFLMPLVERVETPHVHLNRLLNNERLDNRRGFFDDLGRKDYVNAFITMYNFLKAQRIDHQSLGHINGAAPLLTLERQVEAFISAII